MRVTLNGFMLTWVRKKNRACCVEWETARAKEYEIQVSNDAKKWKTVYTNKDGQGSTDEIKLSPVTARYVKWQELAVPQTLDIHCMNLKYMVRNKEC